MFIDRKTDHISLKLLNEFGSGEQLINSGLGNFFAGDMGKNFDD
jgi:hypothetical protein